MGRAEGGQGRNPVTWRQRTVRHAATAPPASLAATTLLPPQAAAWCLTVIGEHAGAGLVGKVVGGEGGAQLVWVQVHARHQAAVARVHHLDLAGQVLKALEPLL